MKKILEIKEQVIVSINENEYNHLVDYYNSLNDGEKFHLIEIILKDKDNDVLVCIIDLDNYNKFTNYLFSIEILKNRKPKFEVGNTVFVKSKFMGDDNDNKLIAKTLTGDSTSLYPFLIELENGYIIYRVEIVDRFIRDDNKFVYKGIPYASLTKQPLTFREDEILCMDININEDTIESLCFSDHYKYSDNEELKSCTINDFDYINWIKVFIDNLIYIKLRNTSRYINLEKVQKFADSLYSNIIKIIEIDDDLY